MITADDVLAVLKAHVGAERGITAAELALTVSGENSSCARRRIRTLVKALRMEGLAVCGQPQTGYFMARSPDELEATIEFLRRRAMTSLVQISKMKRMPLPDLMGQLRLPD